MPSKKRTPAMPEDDAPTPTPYATGDDALAAGMTLVNGATAPANTLDTLVNETRDYIAQGKLKSPLPIAKGGHGTTTAAGARDALGTVAQVGATIALRWDGASLTLYPSINNVETAYLLRVDQGDARYVMRTALGDLIDRVEAQEETIRDLLARVAALEAP